MTKIQEKSASEILVKALQLFGPEGEHWCKEALERDGSYCLLGAVHKVATGRSNGDLGSIGKTALPRSDRKSTRLNSSH